MNQTTKITLASVALLLVIATGVAVKMIWLPSIKDIWFQNARQLRLAPNHLIVVRPTHFSHGRTNDLIYVPYQGGNKLAGRNVTFQQLIAIIYEYNPGRVYLPSGTPGNNFDILVTVPLYTARDRLKKIILNQTGYSAAVQTKDADVLALKVENPNSPNMTLSGPNERQSDNYRNGHLYLTHMKLQDITGGLENFMKTPIVDETGLTNYYNFTLEWKQGMSPNQLSRDDFERIIGEWGLKLVPDTESVEMLVVKKGT